MPWRGRLISLVVDCVLRIRDSASGSLLLVCVGGETLSCWLVLPERDVGAAIWGFGTCVCEDEGLETWLDGLAMWDECGRTATSGVEGQGMARLGDEVDGLLCSVVVVER
jgi:hypothetical protein